MPDGTTGAVVLLEPIEDGLGERHRGAHETQQGSDRRLRDVRKIEIADVHEIFDDVQGSWRSVAIGLGREMCVWDGDSTYIGRW